ncbi:MULTISPECIES: Lrp/AsnC family transcriptional regulator [Flavobacterium]|uniref:AsnC family transcriptional regulator n=2 Tax=Flavobacterium TaxID=237 RepID=A0A1S1J4Z4_9FLAO|nr:MULTISPECIES: Lrp/AsnC ligand binding domain-containing protein [Flavobacterium]MCC9019861.1 Lrp/AsnC ligand binding domain-containing protein [Flavobacterium sp. F-126]MDL2144338.1 Lrp/AsnC ligand binding domain-containing protein [Flavobacterium tructae]OHT44256.1 AsnC family transcriptional regulator [Flavobacterium tructae]OXB20168.1 AsnC family transcriptional regulator [Flavobacterium tructae]OXB21841.1 AsnC family transcriptional regulator [Flavobacterium tructae]
MPSIKKNENTDYLDREIIHKLSENGRISFSDLAKELNISNSLVHLRVRKLQESGIITGFSVKLNPKEIGFETTTYTGIVTKEARFSYSIAEKLKEIPEVVECHWVSGKYALFIKIVAVNNEELRKILYEQIHQIEGVGSTDSFFSFGSAFEKNLPV